MYQYKKEKGNQFVQTPVKAIGNQQLLQQFQMNDRFTNNNKSSVIQREVVGKGRSRKQYYKQAQHEDGIPYGPVILSDAKHYNESDDDDAVTMEEGYTKFESDEQALHYSSYFLTQSQKAPNKFIYNKTKNPPNLPVSCIESATWSMKLMRKERLAPLDPILTETTPSVRGDINYPGYEAFPDWVYDLDKRFPTVERLSSDITLFPEIKAFTDHGGYDLSIYKRFLDRKTFVKAIGTKDNHPNSQIRMIDSETLDRSMMMGLTSYTGGLATGDGILVVRTEDERFLFHAVAIIADFPDGTFIVLERDAGTMEIDNGDTGDDKWLMNVYSDKETFLHEATGGNPNAILLKLEN